MFCSCSSIYPSPELDPNAAHPQVPVSNNTGSLPDLTNLNFPPPLTTPIDMEEGGAGTAAQQQVVYIQNPGNLSPTAAQRIGEAKEPSGIKVVSFPSAGASVDSKHVV